MYVRRQSAALGDAWDLIAPVSSAVSSITTPVMSGVKAYGKWVGDLVPCWVTSENRPECEPAAQQSSQYIPGSSATDYLKNALTGKPTDSQIAYNANQCIASIQKMRLTAPGTIPTGAEDLCVSDQEAYKRFIGGTAEQVISNVIPSTAAIGTTAMLVLGAVLLGIVVINR